MRAAIVLVLRCGLAVTVTTAAVQLWSMALQDDVPLPAPILALPVTDSAVAAALPKRVPKPTQPAVVVSAQLLARAARAPGPAASPRPSKPARPSPEPPRRPSPPVVAPPLPPPPNRNAYVPPRALHLLPPPLIDPHGYGATDEENSEERDPYGGNGGRG